MSYSIFLVDDEPPSLRSLSNKIQSANLGFQISGTAYNGEEALVKIQSAPIPPNIIMTDIQMPVMNGLTLLKKMNQSHPAMRKIVISGYREFDYAKQALDMRVYQYLVKPICADSISKLLFTIRKELEREHYDQIKDYLRTCLRGSVDDNMKMPIPERSGHYRMITICLDLATQLDTESLTYPSWDGEYLAAQLALELGDVGEFWVIESDKNNEFLLVVSEHSSLPQLETAFLALSDHGESSQMAITFAIHTEITDLQHVPFHTKRLFAFMHHRLVSGKAQLLYLDNESTSANGHTSGNYAVQQIRKYIHSHYYEPLEMKELSAAHGISATYLSTIFKKTLNLSPTEYIVKIRMEHAKRLIREKPEMLMKDIAEMAGFTDNHYFSRIFKESVGYSPTEYRQFTRNISPLKYF